MKFASDRPYSDPEKAARKLIEIANSVEAVQDGRIYIEKINGPFLFEFKGSPDEYRAALKLAIDRGGFPRGRTRAFDDPLPALSETFATNHPHIRFGHAWGCDPRALVRPSCVVRTSSHVGLRSRRQPMGEISQFIAMPFDLTEDGLVAGEPFKCASPASAIERAKGYWQVLGHSGAAAFIRTGYPDARITVLRTFGSVPDRLPE